MVKLIYVSVFKTLTYKLNILRHCTNIIYECVLYKPYYSTLILYDCTLLENGNTMELISFSKFFVSVTLAVDRAFDSWFFLAIRKASPFLVKIGFHSIVDCLLVLPTSSDNHEITNNFGLLG